MNNTTTTTYIPSQATIDAIGEDPKTRTVVQKALVRAHEKRLALTIPEVVEAARAEASHKLSEQARFEVENRDALVDAGIRRAERSLDVAASTMHRRLTRKLTERLEAARMLRQLSAMDRQLLGLGDDSTGADLTRGKDDGEAGEAGEVTIPATLQ